MMSFDLSKFGFGCCTAFGLSPLSCSYLSSIWFKGADAPFNTVIKKVNRNTISKNKKKRLDLEEPKRVGGWIEVDGRLWEWKPP